MGILPPYHLMAMETRGLSVLVYDYSNGVSLKNVYKKYLSFLQQKIEDWSSPLCIFGTLEIEVIKKPLF
jgi:hypothetical protein